jgi:hypothetical protein
LGLYCRAIPDQGRSDSRLSPRNQQDLVLPALVSSQTTSRRGKAASKWARSLPISSTRTAGLAHVLRGVAQQSRGTKIHAVRAARQGQLGFGPVFRGQLRHAALIDV